MIDLVSSIVENTALPNGYFRIVFHAPEIAAEAKPGQFVHVMIPTRPDRLLRRPFSIHDADPVSGNITLVCKVLGTGTKELSMLPAGTSCNVIGSLGHGYTVPSPETYPILVAGGFGSVPLYLLAKASPEKGVLLAGAGSAKDLILLDAFEKLSWKVMIATNDGSVGHKGFVTELIEKAMEGRASSKCFCYGCGPTPMLMATAKRCEELGIPGEISMEQHMCCGIGACFACVVKVKDATAPEGWRYSRSCKEGPVYNISEVYHG